MWWWNSVMCLSDFSIRPGTNMKLSDWRYCKECRLHKYRHRVVIGRGSLPCDILMVGMGPGPVEDLKGEPFVGPSGKLLDTAMEIAADQLGLEAIPPYYVTNVVACIPHDGWGKKVRDPKSDEAFACRERLMLQYRRAKAKVIVTFGEVTVAQCKGLFSPPPVALIHPAACVRSGGTESGRFLPLVRGLMTVFQSAVKEERHARSDRRARRKA